ncbi:TIGR03915 family putative DNA repair protein [Mangrovibacterium diazotrophicum]|uniref:Putative DNA metabolism protein n=1 Tax=Mangrovibacterium diazotrophicum TaxID=1261403 RepID=A0A419W3Q9_9BACT|nr:TIGR03915 family putative DNA repair protein [Mangrovibacterium diazotrophicum]RKD90108.1 putative DNA metabolism protein [Mangrovibacterium diazotrophicum]
MAIIRYDGTFAGFLTVVFECYARKLNPADICKETAFQESLFGESIRIETDEKKAHRVWKGFQQKLHPRNRELPFRTFLSEEKGIEMRLYRFMRRTFDSNKRIDTDFADSDVLALKKIERQVMRESMRILEFLRFQQTIDNIYFAAVEPQYDVLPFTIDHFRKRFADQQWIIYDLKRDYGFFYDLQEVQEINLNEKSFSTHDGKLAENIVMEDELLYQTLWKNYFNHVNIEERKNAKLQRQHMPRRYWKFLPEKNQA